MSGKLIRIGIWLAAAAVLMYALIYGIFWVVTFPDRYPDKTLEIERRVTEFFEKITLPIKLAKLSAKEPDSQVLMPVYGEKVSSIANTWQSPRGEGRVHEGQDIFAPRGTPIFSGTYGYVTRFGNGELGGNFVNIVGAGGRRYYYAHLDRFADGLRVGQWVTPDTIIGFVGNTGNAETTPPHLHFGIYERRQPIDPLPLLVNRK